MEGHLTPDQPAFVSQAIKTGRLSREAQAVGQALALWDEREPTRVSILAALNEAQASVADGKGLVITQESMEQIASEVKIPSSVQPVKRAPILKCK